VSTKPVLSFTKFKDFRYICFLYNKHSVANSVKLIIYCPFYNLYVNKSYKILLIRNWISAFLFQYRKNNRDYDFTVFQALISSDITRGSFSRTISSDVTRGSFSRTISSDITCGSFSKTISSDVTGGLFSRTISSDVTRESFSRTIISDMQQGSSSRMISSGSNKCPSHWHLR